MTAPIATTVAKKLSTGSASVSVAQSRLSGKKTGAKKPTGPKHAKPETRAEKGSSDSSSRDDKSRSEGASSARSVIPHGGSGGTSLHTGVLIAEWLAGAVLIAVTVPMEKSDYHGTMATMMIRLTALTGAFFVMSVASVSEKAARFSMWFGLLIVLGILFHATQKGTVGKIGASMRGQKPGIELAADYKSLDEPKPQGGLAQPPRTATA